MRAIGFTRRQLAAMLIGESLTIALIGGIVGCLAAYTMLWTADIGREIMGPLGANSDAFDGGAVRDSRFSDD